MSERDPKEVSTEPTDPQRPEYISGGGKSREVRQARDTVLQLLGGWDGGAE